MTSLQDTAAATLDAALAAIARGELAVAITHLCAASEMLAALNRHGDAARLRMRAAEVQAILDADLALAARIAAAVRS